MERTRAFRRYKKEVMVIRRLKRLRSTWWGYIDANGNSIQGTKWIDHIGTETEFMYRTMTTSKYDTRYKCKWGKKGKHSYDYSHDPFTRHKDKERNRRILIDELNDFRESYTK